MLDVSRMCIMLRREFIINGPDDTKIPFPVVHSILSVSAVYSEVRLMCEDDIRNYSI